MPPVNHTSAADALRNHTIKGIAKNILNIPTLTVRNRDSLDFYDCGVASISAALEAAYRAGRLDALRELEESCKTYDDGFADGKHYISSLF